MPGYGCGVHRHFARVLSGDHPHASNAKCSKLRTFLNSSIPQPNNLTNIQQEIIYGLRTNRITWGKIGDIRSTRNSQEASALPPKNYCKSRPAPQRIPPNPSSVDYLPALLHYLRLFMQQVLAAPHRGFGQPYDWFLSEEEGARHVTACGQPFYPFPVESLRLSINPG
jgi:hypothetical protein